MISSAQRTESEIAATVAGTRFPPSYCASLRAARMEAAISSTRLRPSSTQITVAYSLFVRHEWVVLEAGARRGAVRDVAAGAKVLSTWPQKVPAPLKKPSRSEPCRDRQTRQNRLPRAPILIHSPARESTPALGSQWENSRQQRETAIAKRSPTRPPHTVGGGATGLTPTVPSQPAKLSMPHAATNTASRSDTPIFVRESSSRASTPRLPSVFTG